MQRSFWGHQLGAYIRRTFLVCNVRLCLCLYSLLKINQQPPSDSPLEMESLPWEVTGFFLGDLKLFWNGLPSLLEEMIEINRIQDLLCKKITVEIE